MKTRHMMVLTALLALGSEVRAQADAVAPAQSEMQKWIDTTDGQWQAAFTTGITEVRETELKKVKLQYLNTLETAVAKVSGAGDLDGAVALRAEQKRFSETEFFPAQDEAGDAVAVKQIRVAIRAQLAQVEKDTGARTKALLAKYDQLLAQAQAQLTQAQRLDEALLVKAKRAEVAAAWLGGSGPAGDQKPAVATQPAFPPKIANKPPMPAKGAAKTGDIPNTLAGTWIFSWDKNGWNEPRTFKADGTFTATDAGKKIAGEGKWQVVADRIVVTYADGSKDELVLPLDPKGTKVIGKRGREMKAVKE